MLSAARAGAARAAQRAVLDESSCRSRSSSEWATGSESFGKRVLITSRDRWPIAEVVAGYRSQSDAEFSFRQLKDRQVVLFAPMHHWTDHHTRVHLFTCVLSPSTSPTSCAAP